MMNEHTAKAFDVDLSEINRMVAEMGGLAEKQIADSVDALASRDAERGKRVVVADGAIDTLQHNIEERAVLTIARRQPMAVDLREIVSALRCPGSGPVRILSVTGTATASTTASTIAATSGSFASSAEPAGALQTFLAGQPMLMSMISAPRSTL